MSRYIRPDVTGATVCFTVNLARRGNDLLVREVDRLREAVRMTRLDHPFGIVAWVVLPDHVHCIWQMPAGDRDFGTRWRLIKARFSRGLPMGQRRESHAARGERGVWQRRFWEYHVRDDADLARFIRYCWINPVKHGLVEDPKEWPFCRFIGICRTPEWQCRVRDFTHQGAGRQKERCVQCAHPTAIWVIHCYPSQKIGKQLALKLLCLFPSHPLQRFLTADRMSLQE